MVKGSHTSSILMGKDKRCYLTGETGGLEKHHIYFGAGLPLLRMPKEGCRLSWKVRSV